MPDTTSKKGKDYPVGPLLLGFFVFVVIGSCKTIISASFVLFLFLITKALYCFQFALFLNFVEESVKTTFIVSCVSYTLKIENKFFSYGKGTHDNNHNMKT